MLFTESSSMFVIIRHFQVTDLLPSVCSVTRADYLNTFEFLDKLADNLKVKLASQPKL